MYQIVIAVYFILITNSLLVLGERVAGSVAEFRFTREECLQGNFRDYSKIASVGNLMRNMTTTRCLMGNGIELLPNRRSNSPPIWSEPLNNLLPILNKTKIFTIDFWVEADASVGVVREMSLLAMSYLTPGASCTSSLRV